jgi:hypothetical protein
LVAHLVASLHSIVLHLLAILDARGAILGSSLTSFLSVVLARSIAVGGSLSRGGRSSWARGSSAALIKEIGRSSTGSGSGSGSGTDGSGRRPRRIEEAIQLSGAG